MGKFYVPKTISLDFLGDGWEDCYLKLNAFSINDLEKLMAFTGLDEKSSGKELKGAASDVIGIIEDKFIEGKAFDGKKVVAIEKKDLGDLPTQCIPKITEALSGGISPKG